MKHLRTDCTAHHINFGGGCLNCGAMPDQDRSMVNLAAPNQQKRGFILRPSPETTDQGYQPQTGEKCGCRPGIQRDNCPACEGTGWQVDFAAIRARRATQ